MILDFFKFTLYAFLVSFLIVSGCLSLGWLIVFVIGLPTKVGFMVAFWVAFKAGLVGAGIMALGLLGYIVKEIL